MAIAFVLKEETAKAEEILEKPHTEKELSPMEMSIICSNLARGCEKQYMPEESESFRKLAEIFHQKAEPVSNAGTETLLELINHDISVGFPYGKSAAEEQPDRGALRCQAMAKADLKIEDIDLVEANEAFAAQSIAVARELGFDMAKVNVNGGAISIGHPVGASGARIIVTLLHEMQKRDDAKLGMATLCIGGGMGVATIFEKC